MNSLRKTETGTNRLLNAIARSIGTRKEFIRIVSETPIEDGRTLVCAVYRGGFVYRLIVCDFTVEKIWRDYRGVCL